MVYGIGVDLISVSRIKKVHDKFGARFARRFLSTSELVEYDLRTNKSAFLAKRFAAKEAAVKALGTGERQGILLKDFYLTHNELGKPLLHATGKAKQVCDSVGITGSHITLTDERDQVIALAVLETGS